MVLAALWAKDIASMSGAVSQHPAQREKQPRLHAVEARGRGLTELSTYYGGDHDEREKN